MFSLTQKAARFDTFVSMIKDIIILLLIGYVLYKLFSRFILPIVRLTSVANDQMNRMQQQMADMQKQQQQEEHQQARRVNNNAKPKEGDFIEFEEVK